MLKDVLNILKCAVTAASGGRSAAPLATSINFWYLFLAFLDTGEEILKSLFFTTYPSLRFQEKCQSWCEVGDRSAGSVEWNVPLHQWQLIVTAYPVMPCPEPSRLLKCRTGYNTFQTDVLKSMNRVYAVVTCVTVQVRIVILGLYYIESSYSPRTLGRPMERPTFLGRVAVSSYSVGPAGICGNRGGYKTRSTC